jgi:hypothetical protein
LFAHEANAALKPDSLINVFSGEKKDKGLGSSQLLLHDTVRVSIKMISTPPKFL